MQRISSCSTLGPLIMAVAMIGTGISARADFTLPGIFADRMILQRDLPAAVFGSGDPGETITVTLRSASGSDVQTHSTKVAENNLWRLYLDPTPAGGPYALTVADADVSRTFQDVLFGEVWLMSGQSNMANPVGKTDYAPLVQGDNFPHIRAYQQRSGWTKAETFNIQFLYAQAYFFARAIHRAEQERVPIGFYSAAYVNSAIHEWMDPQTLAEHPESATKDGAGRHFNNLVLPAMGYTFRGMIWDQGENNGGLEADSNRYGNWLRSLITHWRTLSGNPKMIVIIPQLPTIRDEWRNAQDAPVATGGNDRTTRIRQGQFAALALPETYLITTWDTSDGDIHPRNALQKGERAALVYQNRVMGRREILDQGPTFVRQEIQGDKLVLHFTNTGDGLALNPDVPATLQVGADPSVDLLGMAIAGEDGKFSWAKAKIDKTKIELSSPDVAAPTQARYVWADDLRQLGNLVNSAGLPTPSFRSDFDLPKFEAAPSFVEPPAEQKSVSPRTGIYEAELADFRSTSQAGGLDGKISLSGNGFLSTNGKTWFTEWSHVSAEGEEALSLTLRYRSKGARIMITVNGKDVATDLELPNSNDAFAIVHLPEVSLRKGGNNRIKISSSKDSTAGADLDALAVGNPAAFEALTPPK